MVEKGIPWRGGRREDAQLDKHRRLQARYLRQRGLIQLREHREPVRAVLI